MYIRGIVYILFIFCPICVLGQMSARYLDFIDGEDVVSVDIESADTSKVTFLIIGKREDVSIDDVKKIASCHNLRLLDVSQLRCHRGDSLLPELKKAVNSLVKLEYLNLSNVDWRILEFKEFKSFRSLKYLWAYRSNIKDVDSSIKLLLNLEHLELSGASYSHTAKASYVKTLPFSFADLKKLKYLSLSYCNLDTIPACIYKLTELVELDLYANNISFVGESIVNLKKLKFLELGSNPLKNLNSNIFLIRNLRKLGLSNTNLTRVPEEICKLPFLQSLSLGSNRIKEIPTGFTCLENLTHLSMEFCELSVFPDASVLPPNIKELFLSSNKIRTIPKKSVINAERIILSHNPIKENEKVALKRRYMSKDIFF